MSGTWALALRNLLRNRRRSIATLLAMVLGTNTVLLFGGYSRNITYGLQTDYVKFGGHLQVQRAGYYRYGSGNPAEYGMADYGRIIEAVKADAVLASMVRVATPTLQLQGIAGNFAAGVSRTALGMGMVVEDQNQMRAWNDYAFPVILPPLALTGTADNAAIVGTGLARVLQLCTTLALRDCDVPAGRQQAVVADLPVDLAALAAAVAPARDTVDGQAAVELLAATSRGAPNVARLQVVKAEEQGVKEYDDVYVGMHLTQAQRLVFGGAAHMATAVVLQLHHTAQLPAAKARLEQLLKTQFPAQPTEVLDYTQLNPFYGQALAMFATLLVFVSLLIAAIVLFTIGNTLSTAVVERTVEIGTLRAMGLRRAGIRKLFICEGLLLGLAGAALGVISAAALAGVINHSGLTWTPPGRSPVPLIIRVWGETELLAITALGLVLVAVVSAWLPARRASRLGIVDALRHA
jgi:putative ABC transport system permease protein